MKQTEKGFPEADDVQHGKIVRAQVVVELAAMAVGTSSAVRGVVVRRTGECEWVIIDDDLFMRGVDPEVRGGIDEMALEVLFMRYAAAYREANFATGGREAINTQVGTWYDYETAVGDAEKACKRYWRWQRALPRELQSDCDPWG